MTHVTEEDLGNVRSAGLIHLCRHLRLSYPSNPKPSNERRRADIWAALPKAADGRGRIDAAIWKVVSDLPSKVPNAEFERLVETCRLQLRQSPLRPDIGQGLAASGAEGGPTSPSRRGSPRGVVAEAEPRRDDAMGGLDGRTGADSAEIVHDDMHAGAIATPRGEATAGAPAGTDGEMDADEGQDELGPWTTMLGSGRKRDRKRRALGSPLVHGESARREPEPRAEDSRRGSQQKPLTAEDALQHASAMLQDIEARLSAVVDATSEQPDAPSGTFLAPELRAQLATARSAARALCAGMTLQRMRDVAEEQRKTKAELQRAKKAAARELSGTAPGGTAPGTGGGRGGSARSWRDVVASRTPLKWEEGRSFFLTPVDHKLVRRQLDLVDFEDAFRGVLPSAAPAPSSEPAVRQIARTARGAVRLDVAGWVADMLSALAESGRPLALERFGQWRVERARPAPAPSLVVMGVAPRLSDAEVRDRILAGSQSLVPTKLHPQLSQLRASRLLSRRRAAGSGDAGGRGSPAPGASNNAARQPHLGDESVATRSVRVFATSELIDGFLKLGYLRVGGVVARVREYAPPTVYCKFCKRYGSHPSEAHRFAAGGGPTGRDSPR